MTTAKKRTKEVERVVTENVTVVDLELSLEEAQALKSLLGRTQADGPLYKAYQALGNAGVDGWVWTVTSGSIKMEKR